MLLAIPDDHEQRLLLPGGEPKNLVEIDIIGAHSGRQRPVEVVQHAGQRQLQGGQREHVPRATSPTATKGKELVVWIHDDICRRTATIITVLEPLRREVKRPVPDLRVPAHGEGVDEHARPCRDMVAAKSAWRHGLPRNQQRDHRMQPEGLLDDGAEVVEVTDVRLLHGALVADDATYLVLRLLEDARVPEQLGHHPLQCGERRV
uniref:Uncharacterized protein n=1 Tax=Zea mays TaxID=4577 RepID=A0A804NJC8_MAIZE